VPKARAYVAIPRQSKNPTKYATDDSSALVDVYMGPGQEWRQTNTELCTDKHWMRPVFNFIHKLAAEIYGRNAV
jgi:hypothetical protein